MHVMTLFVFVTTSASTLALQRPQTTAGRTKPLQVSPIDFADLHRHAAALDWSSLQLAAEEAYAPFGAITAEGLAKMGIYGGAYHDGAGTTADYWEGAKGWCLPGWRVFQHTFQDTIVNLHGVVEGAIGKQNSWGFTIALFTFCVRTVILPVTWLQYSGSERVKALKPYIDKIKAKYCRTRRNFGSPPNRRNLVPSSPDPCSTPTTSECSRRWWAKCTRTRNLTLSPAACRHSRRSRSSFRSTLL